MEEVKIEHTPAEINIAEIEIKQNQCVANSPARLSVSAAPLTPDEGQRSELYFL